MHDETVLEGQRRRGDGLEVEGTLVLRRSTRPTSS